MSDNAVLVDIEDGIATLTLNHPNNMNALSDDMKEGIVKGLNKVARQDHIRCLVLEGSDRAFCAGGDVDLQDERLNESPPPHEQKQRIIKDCEEIPIRIFELSIPTIAKIDGYCVGAGMGLAFACDFYLASDEAKFGLVFQNVGLTLDFATSYLIPRLVGPSTAKKLALTGEIFSAKQAAEMGLVDHVYPSENFDREANNLIKSVAQGPTVAHRYSIRNIDCGLHLSIRDAVEQESSAQAIAVQTNDHEEGVKAFSQDREPTFRGE